MTNGFELPYPNFEYNYTIIKSYEYVYMNMSTT